MGGWLNQYTILGFPLGYYMAAQGALAIFVAEIAVYAYLMNKKDVEFGIREEEQAMMSLERIFGLYTIGFLGVTILIGIEAIGLFSNQMIGWIFMALSLMIYV